MISSDKKTQDEYWMNRALALARRGEGLTRPNPPVGAVVVSKNTVIGRGFHKKAGEAHAEVLALISAGKRTKNSVLYISLEPCSTIGRTGRCTDKIISAGISRVVVSIRDPNSLHNGKGLLFLKKAGIEITEHVCKEKGAEIIAPFAKWINTGKPYLTLKMGMTMDGRIADFHGTSKWVTSDSSRKMVKKLRGKVDAIIVGSNTAIIDDPSLLSDKNRNKPYRVVVDTLGKLKLSAKVFQDGYADRTIIATTKQASAETRKNYASTGALVWELPLSSGHVSLKRLMGRLGKMGLLHVLCEGGGGVAGGMIRADLVDDYFFFIAPMIMGDRSVPVVSGVWDFLSAPRLNFLGCKRVGVDILLRAQRKISKIT